MSRDREGTNISNGNYFDTPEEKQIAKLESENARLKAQVEAADELIELLNSGPATYTWGQRKAVEEKYESLKNP